MLQFANDLQPSVVCVAFPFRRCWRKDDRVLMRLHAIRSRVSPRSQWAGWEVCRLCFRGLASMPLSFVPRFSARRLLTSMESTSCLLTASYIIILHYTASSAAALNRNSKLSHSIDVCQPPATCRSVIWHRSGLTHAAMR